jgi:Transposase DDE domain
LDCLPCIGHAIGLATRLPEVDQAVQKPRYETHVKIAIFFRLVPIVGEGVFLQRRRGDCDGARRSKGGQEGQALGRSRGGFTTKIHAKSDASGDIIAFDLTGGEAPDARHFDVLLDIGPDIQPRAVICDKGYASKANREAARAA